MTKFNFDEMKGSEHRKKFYKENWNKPITEEEFVKEVISWPKKKLHNSVTRSPSKSRSTFRQLRKNYGFFPVTPIQE